MTHFVAKFFSRKTATASRAIRHQHREVPQQVQAETLEPRNLLTAFVVNTLLDSPANDATDTDGLVSLREAINAANSNTVFGDAAAGSAGLDTITFASFLAGQTLTLGGEQLEITESLNIVGLGRDQITINGNEASRIFEINSGATVEISGMTLADGSERHDIRGKGGAILNESSTLKLDDMLFNDNISGNMGGGIANYSLNGAAFLSVTNSKFVSNVSIVGGAIANRQESGLASVTISETTFEKNSTSYDGGALNGNNGYFSVSNSTFSKNKAEGRGGAIALSSASFINFENYFANVTLSGNQAWGEGGGVFIDGAKATFTNSTIVLNKSSAYSTSIAADGGGVFVTNTNATLNNTIVMANVKGTANGARRDDLKGSVGGFNNLIGDASSAGGLSNGINGNIVGGYDYSNIRSVIDPNLSNNGGKVKTHRLKLGGIAVNKGKASKAVDRAGDALDSDARGNPHARKAAGNSNGLKQVDIGAYELQPLFVVNTLVDDTTGTPDFEGFSLRDAIREANRQQFATDIIRFDPSLAGGTIEMVLAFGGAHQIRDDIEIIGLGSDQLTIRGNGRDSFFKINLTQGTGNVKISGLTLQDGRTTENGGAIYNRDAILTLTDMQFLNNRSNKPNDSLSTIGFGGAIYAEGGYLSIRDSIFEGNESVSSGGAIYVGRDVPAVIRNSSFIGNTSQYLGGAIQNFNGRLIVMNSLFEANVASLGGGAIQNLTSSVSGLRTSSILNSTFSGNISGSFGAAIYHAAYDLEIRNSTFTANRSRYLADPSTQLGAIFTFFHASTSISLYNSIVAGNTTGRRGEELASDITGKALSSASSNNIIGDAATAAGLTNGSNGNIVGVDVAGVLDTTLRDNGGNSKTHALIAGSVAVNAGSNAEAKDVNGTALKDDQRGFGFKRIIRGTVDIGAFEGVVYSTSSIAGYVNGDWWVSSPDANNDYSTSRWARWGTDNLLKVVHGDFNGDGLQDVAGWLPSGEWRVGLASAAGTFTFQRWARWRANDVKEIHVGDFNNDGRDDIIGLFKNGTRGDWWIGQSTGSRFVSRKWGTFGSYDGIEKVLVGNFDGINGTDLAILTTGGAWWNALSTNSQSLVNRRWTNWNLSRGVNHYQVGDFDGNGKDDIAGLIGTARRRDWQVGLSTGSSFVNRLWGRWSVSQSLEGVVAGDFNGDGKTDLAGLFNQRDWWVGVASTGQFVTRKWATWDFVDNNLTDIQVGSSNGDGKQDIFARRTDNGQWVSLESAGNSFATRDLVGWSDTANWQHVQVGVFAKPSSANAMGAPAPVAPEQSEKSSVPDAPVSEKSEAPASSREAEFMGDKNYEVFGDASLLELLHSF